MEEWKDIQGYEGRYQISNLGRVKSLNRKDRLGRNVDEKILKQHTDTNGYKSVMLSKNNDKKRHRIHRLVAEAFIPNPDDLPEVNHKIDDFEHRGDNRVENLEWCTSKYNCNYGNHGKRISDAIKGKYMGSKHPRSKKIKCITTGEIFGSLREACREYSLYPSDIGKCCKGKLNYVGKHPITGEKLVWQYIEEVR